MTDLSQALAHGIANRRREKSFAEKAYLLFNAASEASLRAIGELGLLRDKTIAAVIEAQVNRIEKAGNAPETVSKAVRRRWAAALHDAGKDKVRYYLARDAHLPPCAPFHQADCGIKHGATRYPTVGFATDWADDAPVAISGNWRGLMIGVTFLDVVYGALLLSFL